MESREEVVTKGLAHVAGHAHANEHDYHPDEVTLITEGRGSRKGCMENLLMLHRAKSSYAWFGLNDLNNCKHHAYVFGKIFAIQSQEFGINFLPEQYLFWVLISDHHGLIDWFKSVESQPYWKKAAQNVNMHFFRHYQMTLAVRGDWFSLRQRAEQYIQADPPKLKKFMVDQRFYLALANGDIAGMQEALTELTSPKMARLRNDQIDFAFTAPFIGTHATAYAKIAWRHGYQVAIDTPYIPAEWLPVLPLAHYDDPYPFMREYPL